MKETLLLIDGNNFSFMAFGRTPLAFNGQRTEIISIGLSMIRRYLSTFAPNDVQIAYDGGCDVRRIEIYPDYKHSISKKPLTEIEKREKICFFDQLRKFKKILFELGFSQWRCTRREADDVIFNVLKEAFDKQRFESAIVVSTDSDMFQLFHHFEDKIILYSPVKDIIYTKKDAENKFGFPMNYFVFYRSLVGDASDNLPGIKGIGPVKAKKIVDLLAAKEESSISTEETKLLLLLQEKDEELRLMNNLVEFKIIPEEELLAGMKWIGHIHLSDKIERLVGICERYGLQQPLDNFGAFSSNFYQYWTQEEERC